jgi:hypothetical protein
MGPHPKNLYNSLVFQHLVNKAMLNVNPTGIGSSKIANQFFERRWSLKRISPQDREKNLGLPSKSR